MIITITLLDGKKLSQAFSSTEVTIGRGQKANFFINDDALSRVHAKIELIENEFFVTDLGSTNGVMLDGKKIPPLKRTPIATFLILHIGPLECTVTEGMSEGSPETSGQTLKDVEPVSSDDSTKVTRTLRGINRAALSNPLPQTKKEDDSNSQFLVTVVFVLFLLGGAIYYHLTTRVAPEPLVPAPKTEASLTPKEAVTEKPKVAKNDFLRLKRYEELAQKKSCKVDFEVCHAMELLETENEGSFIFEEEAFIFTRPKRKVKNFPALEGKSDAELLVALNSFFTSPLYAALKNKQLQQVHLLIQNEEPRIVKVFRFYSKTYVENEKLMDQLRDGVSTGHSSPFWETLNAQVKSKSF